jgi:hypothetical protein
MKPALIAPTKAPRLLAVPTHEPREIHPDALTAIAMVKRLRLADLYEREQVIAIIEGLGFAEGAAWLQANRHLYFVALRQLR